MPRFRRGAPKSGGFDHGGGVATLDGPPPNPDVPTDGRSRRRYDPAWDEWKPPRRWPGVLITCVIVLAFLAAVAWHYRPQPHASTTPLYTVTQHPQPPFIPALSGGARVTSFQGKKPVSGLSFNSTGGLTVFHVQCKCTYNFIVQVTDAFGNIIAIPASTTGPYDGTSTIALLPGRYKLSVVGAPKWSVDVIAPTARVPALATPFNYSSTGASVIGPFSSANQYLAFRYFQTASGGATVKILTLGGVPVQTAFTGSGQYQNDGTFTNLPSPYYVQVTGSGYWNLTVRRTAP